MIENIKTYFENNPAYFGIIMIIVGIVLLVAACKGSKWLFEKDVSSTYNLNKIDGWINMYGKKTARVLVGISSITLIIAGVVWFVIYAFYL